MEQLVAAADALWRVLLVGLVLGAGLPALFSWGVNHASQGHRLRAGAAYVVVAGVVVSGIAAIVAHGLGVRLFA